MGQAFVLSGVVLFAITGLVVSNSLYDRGVPNTISRCAAPVLGGTAYLFAVLWLDAWTATVLSGAMAMLILALRLGFRRGLRGVRGSLPTQAWSEVTYALAGTGALAVGWGLLGDRWLAFLPIAFMAWGTASLASPEPPCGTVEKRARGPRLPCSARVWQQQLCSSPTGLGPSVPSWLRPRSGAGPWSTHSGTTTCTAWRCPWLSWGLWPGSASERRGPGSCPSPVQTNGGASALTRQRGE